MRGRGDVADHGFSLIEIAVELSVTSIVLAALIGCIVRAHIVTHHETGHEVASHVATDAMENLRTMPATSVAGTLAATGTTQKVVDGIRYSQRWELCWPASGGTCVATKPAGATLLQVTSAVDWSDRACPPDSGGNPVCTYRTTTMIGTAPDPMLVLS